MSSKQSVWLSLKNLVSFGFDTQLAQSSKVRRHAASIIGTLVSASSGDGSTSKTGIEVEHIDTTITDLPVLLVEQNWLIPTLIDCIQNETDVVCVRRHLTTIHFVITKLNEYSANIGFDLRQTESIPVSLIVIVTNGVLQRRKRLFNDIESRILACEIIASLLITLNKGEKRSLGPLWPIIETSLVQTVSEDANCQSSESSITADTNDSDYSSLGECSEQDETSDKLILTACHALTVCMQQSPWDRGGNTLSNGVFERLLSVLQNRSDSENSKVYKEFFASFLLHLLRSITKQFEFRDSPSYSDRCNNLTIDHNREERDGALLLSRTSLSKSILASRSKSDFLIMLVTSNSVMELVNFQLKSALSENNPIRVDSCQEAFINTLIFLHELIRVDTLYPSLLNQRDYSNRGLTNAEDSPQNVAVSVQTFLSIRAILAKNDRLLVNLADICVKHANQSTESVIKNISKQLLLHLIPGI